MRLKRKRDMEKKVRHTHLRVWVWASPRNIISPRNSEDRNVFSCGLLAALSSTRANGAHSCARSCFVQMIEGAEPALPAGD